MKQYTLILVMLLLTCLISTPVVAFAAEGRHQDWTEAPASEEITELEASALCGAPAERILVLWSVDYDTASYPVNVRIRTPGLDGLTIHVFEFTEDGWKLIGSGIGPELEVFLEEGGSLSVAAVKGSNAPIEETEAGVNDPAETGSAWSVAAVSAALLGLAWVLVYAHLKKL